MNILLTADWHLKLGQKNVPVNWALNRYRLFFKKVYEIEKTADIHIIAGDLFDRLPTLEELALYFEFVKGVSVRTVIFDGNHEATKKNHTFLSFLKEATKNVNPLVEIVTESCEIDNTVSILPYCGLHKKGSIESFDTSKPLFTHVRGEIPPHVKPEVDLDRFEDFPVVFAGDLHAHSNSQRNIVYPGSPMTTSFHRSKVETGYITINLGSAEWDWHKFELPQLIRKTVETEEEMVSTDYDHTIYEIEGDIQSLASVKNSELLDKRVVRRNTEATLIIDPSMGIKEELVEYLQYILEIPQDRIPQILGTFNDYTKDIEMG